MIQDIVDARTYDKMRPPRPGGNTSHISRPYFFESFHISSYVFGLGLNLIFIISCKSEKSNSTVDKIFSGQPTKVEFHVTVMSLDSINEGSMVSHFYKIIAMMTMILGLIKIIMKSLTVVEYQYQLTSYMGEKLRKLLIEY